MHYRLEIKAKEKFRETKNFGDYNIKMIHENIREMKTRQILIFKMFLLKRIEEKTREKKACQTSINLTRSHFPKILDEPTFFDTIPFPVILKSVLEIKCKNIYK